MLLMCQKIARMAKDVNHWRVFLCGPSDTRREAAFSNAPIANLAEPPWRLASHCRREATLALRLCRPNDGQRDIAGLVSGICALLWRLSIASRAASLLPLAQLPPMSERELR